MSSFIIQLLIISVVGLMVQSAPVTVTDDHLHKRQAAPLANERHNQKALEEKLYCAATKVRNTAKRLNSTVTLNIPTQYAGVNEVDRNPTYDQLTKYCMNFIMTMSLKHHLQDLLLDTNTSSHLSSDNIGKLSVILIKLQTMANIFDDIQVVKHSSSCVTFTPDGFKTIYKYTEYTNTSLLQAIFDMANFWVNDEDSYEHQEARHCTN